MLTGGMEDVYNPLLFGLNPSLCLILRLSVKRQGPHILTHLGSASSRAEKAAISVSLLPAGSTNISAPRKHLSTRQRLWCLRFSLMEWFHCYENQEYPLQALKWSILSSRDRLSVVVSVFTGRQSNMAFFRAANTIYFLDGIIFRSIKCPKIMWNACYSFPELKMTHLNSLFCLTHSQKLNDKSSHFSSWNL